VNGIADKTYIHAKIHALHASLLSADDYLEIARSGNFHAVFPGSPAGKDASDIVQTKEKIFRRQAGIFILLAGLNDFYGEFFRSFLLLFELNNIKSVLLRSYGKNPPPLQWNDVSPCNIIDESCIKRQIPLHELSALFAGTVFSGVMDFDSPPSYEALEREVDFVSLKNLLGLGRRLLPADRRIFNNVVLKKIISLKIVWAARSDAYYGSESDFRQFDPVDVFGGSTVTSADIEAVEAEIRKSIKTGYQAPGAHVKKDDVPGMELFLDRLFVSHIKRIFSGDFHGICPVISYAWLLYYQIRNLFTVIEGRFLKVDPETIMRRVVTGIV